MALFSYPVCTWLCQYVNMGVRKWLEKSAEKQKYKMRKTANPLSRKAFRAVSFSATKDKMNDPTQFEQVDETCEFGGAVLCSESLDMTAFLGIDAPWKI